MKPNSSGKPQILIAEDSPVILVTTLGEERRHIEREQARLVAIIEATPDMVATGDPDGHVLYYNRAGLHMLGFEPGLDLSTVRFLDTHPEWAAKLVAETGIPHAIEHGTWSGETALLRRDGREIPISQVIIAHKGPDGSVEYLSTIARDITQRKQAEDELRKLSLAVEQSPNSIMITDLDANLEYVNDAFVKATGYSRAEAIGQNPRILHSDKNSGETYADMWAHLTRGETWKGEFINRRKDGSEYVESILISPVRDSNGQVTHYLGIKEDITERKLAESKLAEQIEELRRWHEVTLGREMRSIELKREVNELLAQAGQPPRYPSAELVE